MAPPSIYAARLLRLPLLATDGVAIGRIEDVVLSPGTPKTSPRVLGFVAGVQRRQIFVNANRVGDIGLDGVCVRTGTVDLRRFQLRPGELLATALLDRRVRGGVVNDIALSASEEPPGWSVAGVVLGSTALLRRRRASRFVAWTDVPELFDAGPVGRAIAELRDRHPADVAAALARLSPERRVAVVEAMEDDELADLLEELPEHEQVELIERLDIERAADVIEEMEADDAVDLLAELPKAERDQLLAAIEPDEAIDLRRLLRYQGNTAGGLMTPEALIVTPETTVAEVLARMRDPAMPAALAAQVFVTDAPTTTPTGRYLGSTGFQRLLREPPGCPVINCVEDVERAIPPEMRDAEVARRLAAYDAVAVAVCDTAGRLVGVVTVDDVLDRLLPAGWRSR